MERLTAKTENGNVLACCIGCESVNDCSSPCEDYFNAMDRLSDFEDTGLTPEEIKAKVELRENCFNHMKKNYEKLLKMWESICDVYAPLWKELQSYKDAEEQGLLHKAPASDGTSIYYIYEPDEIFETDTTICIEHDVYLNGITEYYHGEFNKEWFLTREEAEEALKGGVSEC